MSDTQPAALTTLSAALDALLPCYPPEVRGAVEAELPVLKLQALRLALEAAQAEAAGLAYMDAVEQPLDYPMMTRVHHGSISMLQVEIPDEALESVCIFIGKVATGDFGPLRDALVASAGERDLEGALLRFLLYQGARLDLWVRTWKLPAFEASGALSRLDREAEERLKFWLALAPNLPRDVHPLRVAAAEIVLRLNGLGRSMASELRGLAAEAMDVFQRVLAAATVARDLPVADAIVLRNEYQERVGGRRLGSAELADLYPDSFPSPGAVDQRRHRLRLALEQEHPPGRQDTPRVVDVALVMMDVLEPELSP